MNKLSDEIIFFIDELSLVIFSCYDFTLTLVTEGLIPPQVFLLEKFYSRPAGRCRRIYFIILRSVLLMAGMASLPLLSSGQARRGLYIFQLACNPYSQPCHFFSRPCCGTGIVGLEKKDYEKNFILLQGAETQ